MVSGPSTEVINAISNPTSLGNQVECLRQLKNDIVGHDQRKELVVRQGIVQPLVNILASYGKDKRSANGHSEAPQHSVDAWTQEDEARLQAVLILGSLASGGLAFVRSLIAAGAPKYLLEGLEIGPGHRIVTATLQALRNLAASASLGEDDNEQSGHPIRTFQFLLNQPTASAHARQQQRLAAEIIALSATDEQSRTNLVNGGVLDTLAALLVTWSITSHGFDSGGIPSRLPSEPPSPANIPTILSAISAIIEGSNYRAQCFLLSPSIRALFYDRVSEMRDSRVASDNGQTSTESLLPPLHVPIYKSVSFTEASSAFPALGGLQPGDRRLEVAINFAHLNGDGTQHANSVISWLIFIARSMQGLNRVMALRLLALVNQGVESASQVVMPRTESFQRQRERERQLAMLAVPLAVKLVQSASEDKSSDSTTAAQENDQRQIREQACEVLALLIEESKELQAAAVDAGAIKRVCPVLKQSFDNVTLAKPMWSATPNSPDQINVPESRQMGPRGLAPEIRHAMICRESALKAIAALAKREDLHRKAIVEAGVVSCIIDSLKPFKLDPRDADPARRLPITAKDGNTKAVIVSACSAAQSMSRSVSLLRTSLIDAGIARPVFELLKHADPEVQIAATDVCCNLLLEFSPMRDDLLAAGAIKTLTEHAKQAEMGLRLASMWALKHLVLASSRDIKIQCLDELGPGFLVGAIQGEYESTSGDVSTLASGGVSIAAGGLSTSNAAGEQVELLNPHTIMDVDDPGDEEEGINDDEDEDGEVMYDEAANTHYQSSELRSTLHKPAGTTLPSGSPKFDAARYLSAVRDLERNSVLKQSRDDTLVQEQALDFVRNMLNGEDCAFMFEHLMRTIGQDKVFSLLSGKLAPIPNTTLPSTGRPNKPVFQPTELILSTIHVITHIANGSPTHKQLLIAQKQLLANWLPHFSHPDRRVRVISVWAVNSLTWVEDDTDRAGAVQRAKELRACKIEQAIRSLANDADLDVRERVKTALRQIDAL